MRDDQDTAGTEARPTLNPFPLRGCVIIVKTAHHPIFVIPGLTRNPVLFQTVLTLDAGSVILDLIQDRHDVQKSDAFLNYDTASDGRGRDRPALPLWRALGDGDHPHPDPPPSKGEGFCEISE